MPSFDALIAAGTLPRGEARALLEHVSGRPREWLLAHGEQAAGDAIAERFVELCRRRGHGEPLAYLIGRREFFGRAFEIGPAVLIPRHETERLIELALQALDVNAETALDLGTGSGCVAITLALARPRVRLVASDCDEQALTLARANAARLGASNIEFAGGDWFDALRRPAVFDLIVSNPPYIAADDPHLRRGDLRFEPPHALIGGADGLAALRRLIAGAPRWLRAGGCLLVEHGFDQADAVRELLAQAGLTDSQSWRDAAGQWRVSGARLAGAPTRTWASLQG